MLPIVSVIIPCFNCALFLAEAISSVLRQDFTNYELLIVDDGSTDDTPNLIKPYLADKRVRYLPKKNGGLSSARNYGIINANGDYIALLDADDIWYPEKLACQIKHIENRPDVGMVFSNFNTFNADGIIFSGKVSDSIDSFPNPEFNILFSRNNFIYPSTVLIRKSIFKKCGFFDENLKSIEDYDMWLRISNSYCLIGVPEKLTKIRVHNNNMSKNVDVMMRNEVMVIDKYRRDVNFVSRRKRIAKIYYLNSDRLVHLEEKKDAIKLFIKAVVTWPFLPVDILVVLTKIILSVRMVERMRSEIESNSSIYSFLYRTLYKKY